jgi:hypothetical protein
MYEARAVSRETLLCRRPLTQRSLSRALDSSFGALQDILEGVTNCLKPPPEHLVYRVAYLKPLQGGIECGKGLF